jgi:hypothetical protein
MTLPELDIARVQRWCAVGVPEHAGHQVRVECEVAPRTSGSSNGAPPWREDFGPEWTSFPIARLRYTAADNSSRRSDVKPSAWRSTWGASPKPDRGAHTGLTPDHFDLPPVLA